MNRHNTHRRPRYLSSIAAALFAIALTVGNVHPAFAQTDQEVDSRMDDLFGTHAPYKQFFQQLQQAVAHADKPAVAGMVKYPIKVTLHGKKVTLRTPRDFIAHYDEIFTPALVDVVAKQTYATLFTRDQGVMIGGGEIWFSGICHDKACKDVAVKIITFNLG
nr:hypothetical protein HUO10_000386 [Paraburkholderia busanensis]